MTKTLEYNHSCIQFGHKRSSLAMLVRVILVLIYVTIILWYFFVGIHKLFDICFPSYANKAQWAIILSTLAEITLEP